MNPFGLLVAATGVMLIVSVFVHEKITKAASPPTGGAGVWGPEGAIGTPGTTGPLATGQPYTTGMPSYPGYKLPSYGPGFYRAAKRRKTGGFTVITPASRSLPGAGSSGGQGLG